MMHCFCCRSKALRIALASDRQPRTAPADRILVVEANLLTIQAATPPRSSSNGPSNRPGCFFDHPTSSASLTPTHAIHNPPPMQPHTEHSQPCRPTARSGRGCGARRGVGRGPWRPRRRRRGRGRRPRRVRAAAAAPAKTAAAAPPTPRSWRPWRRRSRQGAGAAGGSAAAPARGRGRGAGAGVRACVRLVWCGVVWCDSVRGWGG